MKTCFSRASFFLILVYCKICIYLHSDAFEYSTNNAFCRQSAESYLNKEHSKVLKTRRTHKISDQKADKIQERKYSTKVLTWVEHEMLDGLILKLINIPKP